MQAEIVDLPRRKYSKSLDLEYWVDKDGRIGFRTNSGQWRWMPGPFDESRFMDMVCNRD